MEVVTAKPITVQEWKRTGQGMIQTGLKAGLIPGEVWLRRGDSRQSGADGFDPHQSGADGCDSHQSGADGCHQSGTDGCDSHQSSTDEGSEQEKEEAHYQTTAQGPALTRKLCQRVLALIKWKVSVDKDITKVTVQALEAWLRARGISIYTDRL
jgi:hypothetical protein